MTNETSRTYSVPGVSCSHCRVAITEAVSKLEGVAGVEVDLDSKTVTVAGDADDATVVAAIDDAGYDAQVA